MSRNGSGTFSVVNTFVAGATITAAGHNQNWSDLASEMTNSVAADGQTTMTGPLKASSGTVAAPSVTFGADVDTGIYRIGANNIGIAANGAKVVDVGTGGVGVTGGVEVSGTLNAAAVQQNSFALLPVGVMLPYGGATAPSGYLLCYGQAVSRTTYSALFSAISTAYGTGDGSTTFNIPDLRGRVAAGQDDMGGSAASRLTTAGSGVDGATLGEDGGAQAHTLTLDELPTGITSTNSSSIALSVITSQKVLNGPNQGSAQGGGTQVTASDAGSGGALSTLASTGNITAGNADVTSDNTSGDAHSSVQPTLITNYIIFAGV